MYVKNSNDYIIVFMQLFFFITGFLKIFRLPPPPVIWAQRRELLFVTICLEDCKDPILEIKPETLYFKGVGGTEKKMHEITIDFYKEINPEKTMKNIGGRTLELVLFKKAEGPYWPRLTKEKTKAHWLKSDFNKWKDEDDSDVEGDTVDLIDMVRHMNKLDGDDEYNTGFDDVGEEADEMDSDDDDLPDLE